MSGRRVGVTVVVGALVASPLMPTATGAGARDEAAPGAASVSDGGWSHWSSSRPLGVRYRWKDNELGGNRHRFVFEFERRRHTYGKRQVRVRGRRGDDLSVEKRRVRLIRRGGHRFVGLRIHASCEQEQQAFVDADVRRNKPRKPAKWRPWGDNRIFIGVPPDVEC